MKNVYNLIGRIVQEDTNNTASKKFSSSVPESQEDFCRRQPAVHSRMPLNKNTRLFSLEMRPDTVLLCSRISGYSEEPDTDTGYPATLKNQIPDIRPEIRIYGMIFLPNLRV